MIDVLDVNIWEKIKTMTIKYINKKELVRTTPKHNQRVTIILVYGVSITNFVVFK